jgi:hypothetical protein
MLIIFIRQEPAHLGFPDVRFWLEGWVMMDDGYLIAQAFLCDVAYFLPLFNESTIFKPKQRLVRVLKSKIA